MSKNFSHANCAHEATKVGRAKCRRERAKLFADAIESVTVAETIIPNPIMDEVNAIIAGPKMLEMGAKGRDTMRKRAAREAAKK